MGLNIKNEQTHRLIRELAALKKTSQVAAVKEAVEAMLRHEKAERGTEPGKNKKGMAEWLLEISKETSSLINDPRSSKELMDDLYDEETGLPK